VNIAFVKYWGKLDEDLIIPINNSLSMTLNTNDLCSMTEVQFFQAENHKISINGKQEKISKRFLEMVEYIL
jgi:diphosphomevalonate decarboxylase